MVALLQDRKSDQFGTPDSVLPTILAFPAAAAALVFAGALVATNAAGNAVKASADATLKIWGVASKKQDNHLPDGTAGAIGDINIEVLPGAFFLDAGTGLNALTKTSVGQICFASDDHTVNATDNGGTWPAAGTVVGVRTDGQVAVQLGAPSLYATNPEITTGTTAFRARAIVTVNVASLAAFTVAGNDGVTLIAGDTVLLSAQTTPAQNGPYVVGTVAVGVAPLTRPDWWAAAASLKTGLQIRIGGEGSTFKNTIWQTMLAADSFVVDTTDPKLYPLRVSGTSALVAGTFTINTVPIFSAKTSVLLNRKIASVSAATDGGYHPTVGGADGITPGILGVAAAIVEATVLAGTKNAADLSTLHWTVCNQA